MKKNVENFQINGLYFMWLISLTIILAFIMPVMTNAQAGKANFAGNWAFNASKSNLGTPPAGGGAGAGGRGGLGANFVAAQDAKTLTTTTPRTGQDGTVTNRVVTYTLDGKENTLAAPAGGGGGGTPSKYVATWSADGKALTIVTTRTTQNGEMKSTEAWTLTAANTLSRTSTSNFGGTETKRVYVYDKK